MPARCLLMGAIALMATAPPLVAHDWNPGEFPDCEVTSDLGEAFPGAEGYGAVTAGGRCGTVFVVKDLTDSVPPSPGTLRWAAEMESGPRTIVFQSGGEIVLDEPIVFAGDDDSHLTIAGETAPGGGVLIREYGLHFMGTHDVILRHLRVRNIRGFDRAVGQKDTFGCGIELSEVQRVMVDHVSVSWATDEGIGAVSETVGASDRHFGSDPRSPRRWHFGSAGTSDRALRIGSTSDRHFGSARARPAPQRAGTTLKVNRSRSAITPCSRAPASIS